jgi:HEAT repeat protein
MSSIAKAPPRRPSRRLGTAALAGPLGVAETEVARAIRLLALIFATSAALALLKAAQGGVFLSAYPRHRIPHAFAASALLLATASSVSVAAAARLGPVSLATYGLSISSVALLGTRAMLSMDIAGSPFATYVIIETICGIVLIQVWSVVSETIDARSAKRLLPIAGVGAALAWTIFGLLTPRLVALFGATGLLFIAPLLLVTALILVRAIARFDLAGKPAKATDERATARLGLLAGWREGMRFVSEVPLMRVVLSLSVLALLAEQLMDFQLLAAAREAHSSAAEIAGFLGRFHGIVSGVSLVVLLGLSGRVLSRLGAILGLVATPVATVLAAAVAVAVPGLIPIVLLRGVDRVMKNALWTSAMEQTQTPLPVMRRAQARALIRGVVAPLFYAAAAVGLAVIPERFDLRILSLLTLLTATVITAVIVIAVRPRYVLALRRAIDDRRLHLDHDLGETRGAIVPIDIDACEALGRELCDEDEARALLAAEVLSQSEGPAASRALTRGLSHPSPEVRAEAATGLGTLGAVEHARALCDLLARDPISEVRRAAVRSLIALMVDDPDVRAALERAKADTDRIVRANALVAMLAREDPKAFATGSTLLPLLDPTDRDACEAALAALGKEQMQQPLVIEAVRSVLRADDRALRVRALEVVTRTRARELLADIAPLLEDARTAPEAVARLVHWGEGALESAAESVIATTDDESAPMSRLLSHADPAVRDRAARALLRERMPLPRDAVQPVLDREIRRAYALDIARAALAYAPIDETLASEVTLRFRETRKRILQLLALRESRKLVEVVQVGLRRTSRNVEAQIAELLDVALPPELARKIVPLFDRLESAARVETAMELGLCARDAPVKDPLGALVALDDAHLRGCALAAAGESFRARFPELFATEASLVPVYERMRFLRSVPLFGDLPGEDLRTIAEIVETVDLAKGTVVFRKGDPGDDLYVILKGKIAIRDGKLEVASFGPREFFGELSIIDHEPRSADAIVVEDAQLLRLRSSDLGELMAQRPQIQEQFLIVLARRLRAVTQRVATQ